MATAIDARAEYIAATEKTTFTKDFNPSLEALMMDPTATYGQRFMAWLKRRSWGNWRLYAVLESGEPATQAHCSRELGIEKRCVSNVVRFYEERGYLYRKGKMLYPTIAPKVDPLPEKSLAPRTFLQFVAHWKVTCSADFLALEVARSEVERLRKVQIAAYKKWLASETNGGPTLYERKADSEREEPPTSQPDVKVEDVSSPEPRPAGWPPDHSGNGKPEEPKTPSLVSEVRQHLESIPLPRLTDDVVEQVANHINTPALLKQFKLETAPNRVQPRKWVLLIRIAAEIAADGERYAKAATAANSESPPMTNLERKAADYARRRKQEQSRGNST